MFYIVIWAKVTRYVHFFDLYTYDLCTCDITSFIPQKFLKECIKHRLCSHIHLSNRLHHFLWWWHISWIHAFLSSVCYHLCFLSLGLCFCNAKAYLQFLTYTEINIFFPVGRRKSLGLNGAWCFPLPSDRSPGFDLPSSAPLLGSELPHYPPIW